MPSQSDSDEGGSKRADPNVLEKEVAYKSKMSQTLWLKEDDKNSTSFYKILLLEKALVPLPLLITSCFLVTLFSLLRELCSLIIFRII